MDHPINVGGQYGHYPPPDDLSRGSSDMANFSAIGDDQLSHSRLVSCNNKNLSSRDSNIDNEAPDVDDEDDDGDINDCCANVNDVCSVYHTRRHQRRRQQRVRRRDTSCGDIGPRRRPSISLSRSSTRIGQSIPLPPSDPPPSLPSGIIDLNSQYSMYPVLGTGGFNIIGQQTPATSPTMLHIASLPVNYMPHGDNRQRLLQMQHAVLLHQRQQQLHQHILASANASGNPYLQGFATVGHPVRSAGQLNHPHMTLPTHHQPLQDLELIRSAALLQAHHAHMQAPNTAQSAAGSGSVVYENSYNSFQRLPLGCQLVGRMPPTNSQDHLPAAAAAAAAGVANGEDNPNSTSSTTNDAPSGSYVEPPSVVANSPSTLATTSLINFYDAAATSGGVNAYITHPQVGNSLAGVRVKLVNSDNDGNPSPTPRPFWRFSWQYWVILVCVLAFLMAVSFAAFFSENAKWLENRLHEKYAQNPTIFGLFDPQNPPQNIEPNTQVNIRLEPMGMWAGHWHIPSDLCIIYNITLNSELSSVGVFLRYSTMPTIVHYHHFDRILGLQLKADAVVKKELIELPKEAFPSVSSATRMKPNAPRTAGRVRCLRRGHWFVSLVNDQPRTEEIIFSIAEVVIPSGCPNDCSNMGICSQGICDCLNGLTGKDCSSVDTVAICSGHGEYLQGKCHCFPEWKGPECEALWSECLDPTCSTHGRCVMGECLCFEGFDGDACQFRVCPSHNCSANGVCVDGVCRCFSGWDGDACDLQGASKLSIGGVAFPGHAQQQGSNVTSESTCGSFNGHSTTGNCF